MMKLACAMFVVLVSLGCATVKDDARTSNGTETKAANTVTHYYWPFGAHPNTGVRIPARAGGVATAVIVGIPAMIVFIPITAPISEAIDSNLFPMVPLMFCYKGGETLFGAATWPFFGWWHWPDKTREDDPQPACQTSVRRMKINDHKNAVNETGYGSRWRGGSEVVLLSRLCYFTGE